MPIESNCPGCGKKLRVADEHAGRMARCPSCNVIYRVNESNDSEPVPRQESWQMKTPEGQVYGPVDRPEMDQWVAEGRVTADCKLSSGDSEWQDAERFYPVLQEATTAPVVTPAAQPPYRASTTARTPVAPTNQRYRYTAPHRGAVILALGILSWVLGCPVFGVIAWVMGSSDLREMRLGRMDPSGQGLTQAGQIVGMIHAILTIVVLVVAFAFLLFSVIAN